MKRKIHLLSIVILILCFPSWGTTANLFNNDPRNNPANYINVDFDKAQLSELVLLVSEFTGTGFVFNDQVTTPVTWSQKNIYKNDLIPTFINVITSLGFTVTPIKGSNKFYVIKQDSFVSSGAGQSSVGVYQLKNISAESVKDSAELLYGEKLSISFYEDNQVVAFSGSSLLVSEFIDILGRVDKPALPSADGILTVRLQFISVRTAIKAISDLQVFEKPSVFPDYWNRSVLVYGTPDQQNTVRIALSAIDKPQQGWIDQVAFIHTIDVDQAITVLQELYGDLEIRKVASDRVLISGQEKLVSKASGTLSQIDGTGLQVKVEAVIAYLTDSEFHELGIRLSYEDTNFFGALNNNISNTLIARNTGLLIDYFNNFLGIQAAAKDGIAHGEILSSPVLTVLNGQEASIHVGQNVPFLSKANFDQNNGEDVGTSIVRQDIGLTFKIRPSIEPDGDFIRLKVYQEVSNVTDDSELSQEAVDIVIDKKQISSTVLVANGDTIFLGGLRSEESGSATDRIPLLGELPLIGRLFTYQVDQDYTRHLVVSLRVNVIGKPI